MKPETQYANAVNIIRSMAKLFDGYFDNYIETWIEKPNKFFETKLYKINNDYEAFKNAFELLQDAREQMDKKLSPNVSLTAVKSIIREAIACNNRKTNFHGMFESNGMYCVCDGYRLVCLNNDITSLPRTENDFNIEKVFKGISEKRIVLNLPSVADIKAAMATAKKDTPPYIFIDGLVGANAKYLLSMMQSLPGCVAYVPNNRTAPILFESPAGKGLLCPMRVLPQHEDEADRNWKELSRRAS